jgi:transposase
MKNSTQIFEMALQINKPWYIKSVTLTKPEELKRGQLDIYIDFERGGKFIDKAGIMCGVYDTEERSWQHLNFFEHNCFIHARVPRIKDSTEEVVTVVVPWARSGSGFTLLFEAFAMLLIEYEMPVNKVASTLRVVANRLWRMFNYWVSDAVSQDSLEKVTKVGIDETSSKKGHNYVTVCADLAARRVIHVSEGREADVIKELAIAIEEKQGSVAAIKQVSIDMSPAYISGVMKHLPQAKITFDKFHVTAMLNKAMDDLRKAERKGNDLLKGHKYTVLTNYTNLSTAKQGDLDYLLMVYPRLGQAYRLKEMFAEFWGIKEKEAALAYLTFWCDMVMDTDIIPFKKFVKTIKSHWSGIINYIESGINSGIMEGINNKIQLAKRRARGYRNMHNFMNMIYFIAGKLKFNYPYYPL